MRKIMITLGLSIFLLTSPTISAYASVEESTEIDNSMETDSSLEEPNDVEDKAEDEATENDSPKETPEPDIQDGYDSPLEWKGRQEGMGYATFVADVDPSIHETLYVQVMNESTYKEYAYYLYEVNGYTTGAPLPTGYYIITAGGIPTDYTGLFPIQNVEFQIEESYNTTVNFTIGHNNSIYSTFESEGVKNKPYETMDEYDEKYSDNVEVIEQNNMKDMDYEESTVVLEKISEKSLIDNIWDFIKNEILIFLLLGIIGFILYRKKKEKEDD